MIKKKGTLNLCLLKHNWLLSESEPVIDWDRYNRIILSPNPYQLSASINYVTSTRICQRCNAKQMRSSSREWFEVNLTIDEKRDISLREIGI